MRLKMKMLEQEREVTLSICGMELTIDGMEKEEVLTIVADKNGVVVQADRPQTNAINGAQESTGSESTGDNIPLDRILCDDTAVDTIPLDNIHSDRVALLPKSLPEKAPVGIPEDELFRKLAALRKQLAIEQSVPPYVIFNDKSLREMVQKLPEDLTSFYSISGVGKSKLEKYGRIFLDTIRAYKGKMAG